MRDVSELLYTRMGFGDWGWYEHQGLSVERAAHFRCTCPTEIVKRPVHVHLVQHIEHYMVAIQHETRGAHVEVYPRVQYQVMRQYLVVTFG